MYVRIIISTILTSILIAECNTGYTEIDEECYLSSDLAPLIDILNLSCTDYDNDGEYGIVECILNNELDTDQDTYFSILEIGIQLWQDGRLIEFDCSSDLDNEITYCYLAESIMLPENIGNWTALKIFNMFNNGIAGAIPHSINDMLELEHLDLHDNHLVGPLPSIGNLTNLKHINVSNNSLSGNMPLSFSEAHSLEYINLSDNILGGHLLRESCNFTNLKQLVLFSNQFEGGLPTCIGDIQSIEYIDLSENLFSGTIPYTITNLENLIYLNLSENDFSGELPDSWGSTQNLITLDLSYNNLNGIIPPTIGDIEFIENILLHRNNLVSWIPNSLSTLSNLRVLKVAENELEGIIPGFLVYLESHSVYNNNFCPPYPPGCVLGSQNQENCINYEQGNINQDDIIDILDVLYGMNLILGYIPFSNYETWASDVDGDGESDVQDIIYLVQLIINY